MQFHTEKRHVIDILFPIVLFFVFAASAFVVIMLAANIYSSTTASSESHFETGTSLSYVTEKIRQADESGSVSIGTFDGRDSLVLEQTYGDEAYVTYIYVDEDELKEIFLKTGIAASAADGTKIMTVHDFQMKEVKEGLFSFSCTASDGRTAETYVALKSKGGTANEF